MNSVPELIDAFGGSTDFARALDLAWPSTASEMKRNGSIHPRHWPKVIEAAAERGIEGVTAEFLMRLHAREKEASQ